MNAKERRHIRDGDRFREHFGTRVQSDLDKYLDMRLSSFMFTLNPLLTSSMAASGDPLLHSEWERFQLCQQEVLAESATANVAATDLLLTNLSFEEPVTPETYVTTTRPGSDSVHSVGVFSNEITLENTGYDTDGEGNILEETSEAEDESMEDSETPTLSGFPADQEKSVDINTLKVVFNLPAMEDYLTCSDYMQLQSALGTKLRGRSPSKHHKDWSSSGYISSLNVTWRNTTTYHALRSRASACICCTRLYAYSVLPRIALVPLAAMWNRFSPHDYPMCSRVYKRKVEIIQGVPGPPD